MKQGARKAVRSWLLALILVAGADTLYAHTGLAAVEEENFFGKTSSSEPSPTRATHPFVKTAKAVILVHAGQVRRVKKSPSRV